MYEMKPSDGAGGGGQYTLRSLIQVCMCVYCHIIAETTQGMRRFFFLSSFDNQPVYKKKRCEVVISSRLMYRDG